MSPDIGEGYYNYIDLYIYTIPKECPEFTKKSIPITMNQSSFHQSLMYESYIFPNKIS